MDKIIEKLGSYQILTNLLPGAFFGLSLEFFFGIHIPTENFVEDIIAYYFMGFIIDRIGSLVIEPVFKRISFIKFAPYIEFVKTVKSDSKIDILSEMNNFFRSLLTCVILLPFIKLGQELTLKWLWFSENYKWFILVIIFLLLLFAYRKQSNYIRKRVNIVIEQTNKKNDLTKGTK